MVEVLRPFVAEIVVSNPLRTKAIAEAKVKTDMVDAHTLAQLLRVDFLPAVWRPDAATARMRQLTNQRAGLVADCTAIKDRIHAIFSALLAGCLHRERCKDPNVGNLRSSNNRDQIGLIK